MPDTYTELESLELFPQVYNSRIIDFDKAIVFNESSQFHLLLVSGKKPYASMKVTLEPQAYIRRPDYWEYLVVGTLGGLALPVEAPYTAVTDVSELLGTKGIEVVGHNKRQRIDIASDGDGDLVKP